MNLTFYCYMGMSWLLHIPGYPGLRWRWSLWWYWYVCVSTNIFWGAVRKRKIMEINIEKCMIFIAGNNSWLKLLVNQVSFVSQNAETRRFAAKRGFSQVSQARRWVNKCQICLHGGKGLRLWDKEKRNRVVWGMGSVWRGNWIKVW